jgi:5-methylthioribose kinase
VERIHVDVPLKLAVGSLKTKWLTSAEALVHLDLHIGAWMVKEGSTFILDPEFACMGPMAQDFGRCIGSFFCAYYSQLYHNGAEYAETILQHVVNLYESFESKFLSLWQESPLEGGLYPKQMYTGECLAIAQKEYMENLWRECVGFIGCNMLNSCIGIGTFEDFETIEDEDVRGSVDKRVLLLATRLVKWSHKTLRPELVDVRRLVGLAKSIYHGAEPTLEDYDLTADAYFMQ